MTFSEDDEDENLASFLESEILSGVSDDHQDEENPNSPPSKKKQRLGEEEEEEDEEEEKKEEECSVSRSSLNCNNRNTPPKSIETGVFSKVPPELFYQILKFLSSEDLIACSLVCRYLNYAASDESLWRRLYFMRWGLVSPTRKLRESAWKALYIQRDQEDMVEFVRNTPSEFKGYYIQMQAAKRSQAPLPSQVNEDHIILDRTVADQVSLWKVSRGLTDDVVMDHVCSGKTCSYSQIGDVFMCEKTGRVHVCDDTCREVVTDTVTGLLVCTISGHCFDSMLSSAETEPDDEQEQQGGATDEGEPFMGSAWAFLRGYGCSDEKELKSAMRGFGY